MEYKEARFRNLKIKLYKLARSKGSFYTDNFTKEAINKKLYFKSSDINDFLLDLFIEKEDGKYQVKESIKAELESYLHKYNLYSQEEKELEHVLQKKYIEIKNSYLNFNLTEDTEEILKVAKEAAAKLHWIHLPIYKESIIMNSGIIPENNPEEYYNHFHMIEDLYRVIFENEEIKWDSVEGDLNLNKPMKLRIYSTRWGHDDIYEVRRTITGWNFKHLTYDLNCVKDGSLNGSKKDGLYQILKHDSIQYPYEGVSSALQNLWILADSTEMATKDLENYLQDVGNWINAVEKATKKNQPKWSKYY